MNLSSVGVLVGTVVFLLFCLGFGWGPGSASRGPEQVALVGLAAAGLLWPVLVFGLVGRARRTEGTGTAAE